jgi:hypothetical protein
MYGDLIATKVPPIIKRVVDIHFMSNLFIMYYISVQYKSIIIKGKVIDPVELFRSLRSFVDIHDYVVL